MDLAYKAWAQSAEREIIWLTGAQGVKTGLRGAMPKLIMKPILRGKGFWVEPQARLARAYKWVYGRLGELLERTPGKDKARVLATLVHNSPEFVVNYPEAELARVGVIRRLGGFAGMGDLRGGSCEGLYRAVNLITWY